MSLSDQDVDRIAERVVSLLRADRTLAPHTYERRGSENPCPENESENESMWNTTHDEGEDPGKSESERMAETLLRRSRQKRKPSRSPQQRENGSRSRANK